jgi:hypothetical protein
MNFLFFLVPGCLHCKHYKSFLNSRRYDDLAKCTKWNTTLYAEQMRSDEAKCGIGGVWYEPLEKN